MLLKIPLKVKLKLGMNIWFWGGKWTVKMNIHLKYLFRTYLWSILNSNYVMITLWRLTRKPSQTIVFRCFFPGGVAPVRSKRIGRVPWPLCLEPTKFIANPQSSQNIFEMLRLCWDFYEKNFCWVESYLWFPGFLICSEVSHTTAEFAVFFRGFEFSSKNPWWIRHLQNRWTLKVARPFLSCFFKGNPWISGDIFLMHILFLSFLYEIFWGS